MRIKLSQYDEDFGSFEPQDDAVAWEENEIFQENAAERRQEEEEAASPYWVTVYFVDRRYGGAEEGGWWYDWYELEKSVPVATEEEGKAKMNELLVKYPYDADELGSVNGEGTYKIYIESAEEKGDMVSTETPHYE